jgi:hypothetical protein
MFDQLSCHELIAVEDVNPPSTGCIGRSRHGAGEQGVLDEARDVEVLALAEIQADADRELCVAAQKVF